MFCTGALVVELSHHLKEKQKFASQAKWKRKLLELVIRVRCSGYKRDARLRM
jgi:hypothetical protein